MPHVGNLRKRAKALNLVITKTTTAQDAYEFGYNLYVLHSAEEDFENMEDVSLYGIENQIKEKEKA